MLAVLHRLTPRATAETLGSASSPVLLLAGAHDLNVTYGAATTMQAALGAM